MNSKRAALGILLVVIATVVALLIWGPSGRTTEQPLPAPNGYVTLIELGRALPRESNDLDHGDEDVLRSVIKTNAATLSKLRTALRTPCRVPLQYSEKYAETHVADLAEFKKLARALQAESQVATIDSQPAVATASALDIIRLGHECSRGGVLIDMLVGVACRSLGYRELEKQIGQLNSQECQATLQELTDIEARSESADQVIHREKAWGRRTFGWRGRFGAIFMRKSLEKNYRSGANKLNTQQRVERLLWMDVAARAYELEQGKRPETVADLIPKYLAAAPSDPETGVALAFKSDRKSSRP